MGSTPRQTSFRQRSQAKPLKKIFKKLKKLTKKRPAIYEHLNMPHTYFSGSTIFIRHEGPLNWAYLNSSRKTGSQPRRPIYTLVNHISREHDLFNTVAYRLGMTNMLAHPDFFLPGTGKKKSSKLQWVGDTSFQLCRIMGGWEGSGANTTFWPKYLKIKILCGNKDRSDD